MSSVALVAIALPRPAAARAIVAAWEAGEAVLPLDAAAPAPELAATLAAARPTHLLDGDGRRRLAGGEPAEDRLAAVVATSGTGGAPKLVELGADAVEWSARATSRALGAGPGDRWLCCVAPHGVAGLAVLARAWHTGLPVEVHDRFDPAAVAEAAGRATLVSLVPTMLRRLLAAGDQAARFRRLLLGGGPIPPDLADGAATRGAHLVRTYGLTETFGGMVHDGHPLDGVDLRIDEPEGEVLVRGPMLFRRYRGEPARTAAVLREGWLRTGDLGRLDPGGRLAVLGRRDDLVISGGVNVHPDEVEAVLARHPGVAEAAVAGRPDPEWGQRVAAFVVPRDPARPPSLEELRAFTRERLAAAKAPRELVLVPALPRGPSGKLLRRLLPDSSTWGIRGERVDR
ncbi:MAG TPA: AMP-binding protein [Actinomycetota bacterium]|jgi:O-succinylbenzoic acid--CoA ligase|nr:AMP-binding protein [Actinomycetota bacterium]